MLKYKQNTSSVNLHSTDHSGFLSPKRGLEEHKKGNQEQAGEAKLPLQKAVMVWHQPSVGWRPGSSMGTAGWASASSFFPQKYSCSRVVPFLEDANIPVVSCLPQAGKGDKGPLAWATTPHSPWLAAGILQGTSSLLYHHHCHATHFPSAWGERFTTL